MILIDARIIFQDQADGVARVVVEMLRHRPASAGDVGLLLPRGADQGRFGLDALLPGLRVHEVDAPIRHIWNVREIRGVVQEHGYRAFFAPYAPLLPVHVPCATVAHVHDCILEADVRLSQNRLQQLLYIANMMRVLRQVQAVVVPSVTSAVALGAFYSVVPKVVVARNGVNAEQFGSPDGRRDPEETLRRLGVRAPYVLSVGARRPHKNQKVLVEALDRLHEEVSLVLVGNPDPRVQDDVLAAIANSRTRDRIVVLPRTTEADLMTLFHEAAVFAFPSVAEGFGLPPLEAMAAGTPVVASAIPVVAEVTGDAASLVSPYEPNEWAKAITAVLGSAERRAGMVARGGEVVQRFSWTESAAALFSLLADVATQA